jgi:integrase
MNLELAAVETKNGTGAILRRDTDGLHKRRGIWHYKLKVAGRWKEISTGKRNYQEARKLRQQALQDQEAGRLPTDMDKWPFEKAASTWLAGREKMVGPQTHRIDRERLTPLLKVFGGRRLSGITNADVNAYQLLRLEQVGSGTINLEGRVLRMILKAAKVWARIADGYKPLPENKQGPGRALQTEEEKRLFKTASQKPGWEDAYYAALIAANTTARSGEIRGLRIADVDLMERSLKIRRQSTKTDAGCRVIPLNETATWALARLMERAAKLGATEPDHYLLPAACFRYTKTGKNVAGAGYDPTRPRKTWRSAWISLTKIAGLPGLRFHDLRHHCITRLAEEGVPDQTLKAIAGHVSSQMLEHYSHIRMQAKRQAVAAIDGVRPAAHAREAVARA